MSQVTEQSVRFQTALASIKLIQASAVLDLTEDDFDFLTSNKVWIATDRSTLAFLLLLSLLLPSLLIMFIPSTFKRPVSSWKALNLRKTLLMASSVRLKPLNCSRLPCVYAQETLTFLLTQKKTITLHEVITFLVSMQISISSLQTHNVNRCGRSRHLARKLSLRRKRSSPNVFEMAATETITSIILIKLIRVSLGTVRHPRRFKIVVIDIQITLKQMLRDFIGIRVNRAKKSGMVNITSSVNSRERSGINTILHELNPLFTINVTMRDIKSKNVYSRVNSKATTQWRKTESANGVHLEGVASDNRSS